MVGSNGILLVPHKDSEIPCGHRRRYTQTFNLDPFFPEGEEGLDIRKRVLRLLAQLPVLMANAIDSRSTANVLGVTFLEPLRLYLTRLLMFEAAISKALVCMPAGLLLVDALDFEIRAMVRMHCMKIGREYVVSPNVVERRGLRDFLPPLLTGVQALLMNICVRGFYRKVNDKGGILAFCQPLHWPHLDPVLDELAGRGLGTIKFHHGIDLSLDGGWRDLQKLSPLFFLRWGDYRKLCQERMALGKRADEASEAISNCDEFTDFSDVAQSIITDGLRRVIRKEWLVRLAEFLGWKRVLEDLPIIGVLLTEDFLPSERALTLASKDAGIPTWIVQHGLAIHPDGRGFIPFLADKLFCFGESAARFFGEFGLSAAKMEITGRPLYDRWIPAKQEGLKKRLSKSFLFLGQPLYEENLCSYQSYISTIEMAAGLGQANGIKVRLRPHPREATSIYQAIAGKYEGVELVSNREPIVESLRKADTVATCFSTGGLEALLMGKDLICLNPGKVPEAELFAKNLGALMCRNTSDLVLTMRKDAESSETSNTDWINQREKILTDNLCQLDGKATRRIADCILKDLPK